MNGTVDKKDFFYIVVLVLTFITVIVGAAFALYTLFYSQEEGSSAVYTGTLSIEYLSGNIIDTYFLYPTEEPSYDTVSNVYRNNFRVTNTGSLDSLLKIVVEISQNDFSSKTLKYILYNSDGEELSEGYVEGTTTSTIASNVYLENNSSEDFTLIIWLNENGENQNSEMKKSLVGTINVDASQKID